MLIIQNIKKILHISALITIPYHAQAINCDQLSGIWSGTYNKKHRFINCQYKAEAIITTSGSLLNFQLKYEQLNHHLICGPSNQLNMQGICIDGKMKIGMVYEGRETDLNHIFLEGRRHNHQDKIDLTKTSK